MTLAAWVATLSAAPVDELIARGDRAYEHQDYGRAVVCYREVQQHYRKGHLSPGMGDAFNWAGNACMNQGRYAEALDFYTDGMAVAHQTGNSRLFRDLLSNAGIVFALYRDYEQATYYFDRAYTLATQQRDNHLTSIAIVNMATACCKCGDTPRARELLTLEQRFPMADEQLQQFFLSYNSGLLAMAEKQAEAAAAHLRQALTLVDQHQLGNGLRADVLNELAATATLAGRHQEAAGYYRQAVDQGHDSALADKLRDAYKGLERTYMLLGRRDSAIAFQTLYMELTDSFFNERLFSAAKNRLTTFEQQLNEQELATRDDTIQQQWWVIAVISGLLVALAIFAVVIYRYNSNLRSAHKLLVSRQRDYMQQQQQTQLLRSDYLNSIRHSETTAAGTEQQQEPTPDATGTTEPHALSKERREQLLSDIGRVMADTEVIADPEFGLHMLAKLVGSNTKYVSMVINETYGKNFKTYLSEYRIREACLRFAEPEKYGNLTIQGIAADLGYNSTNSFITAFKKIMGMTPSVYVKLIREKNEPEA